MASEPAEKRPVRVTIFNQPYTLLAKDDPSDVQELARSVDELMAAISAKAPTVDSSRVAVLACLHLADRLRSLEQDLTRLKQRVDRKTEEFAELLERVIQLD